MSGKEEKMKAFGRLLDIMDDLRTQCPWDRKQTMESLRNLTIEETYELADAILKKDSNEIKEEVGDILLHMVFYSKIAEEKKEWDVAQALHGICEKLIQRHPHIYGDLKVENEEEVKKNWEQLKMKEGKKSVLSGVPQSLPAMIKAYRMQDKTAQVGFEWTDIDGVWDKLQEEITEFNDAKNNQNKEEMEDEFGDILFSMINYARFLKIDPETALEKVNQKFKNRFEYIEQKAPKSLNQMTLEEMDALWEEAKQK